MKVYVKKGECDSLIPGITVMLIFLTISIWIFLSMLLSSENIMDFLSRIGIGLAFDSIFFSIGIYLLYLLFKKPRKYTAKLLSREESEYNGRRIIYMTFATIKEENYEDENLEPGYRCFTYEDNMCIVNNLYDIYVKEFNWKIHSVEEKHDEKISTADIKNDPVKWVVFLVLLSNILIAALGAIFYSEYIAAYIIWIIIFFIITLYAIRFYREDKNKLEDNDSNDDEQQNTNF